MKARPARWAVPVLLITAAIICAAAWPGCRSGRTTAPQAAGSASTSRLASRPATQESLATLTVTVKDLRNHKGQLIFGVFRSAAGFPNVEKNSVFWETREADADAVTFTAHLPPGRYGASVLHDENRSGDMNRGFANIPTEGYGVTNNPKPALRAATFDEAAFDLPASGKSMTISVQYF